MDRTKLAALMRQPSFWTGVASNVIAAVVAVAPDSATVHRVAAALFNLVSIAGSIAVGVWDPPRVPWTAEQRAAHGLPPLSPKPMVRLPKDGK